MQMISSTDFARMIPVEAGLSLFCLFSARVSLFHLAVQNCILDLKPTHGRGAGSREMKW